MTDNIKAKGETPEESIVSMIEKEKQLIKEFTLKFFFWWYNQKGTNSYKGFDSYMETVEGKLEFNKLTAGRSKSIESEKAKDERIKILEEFIEQFIPDPYPEDVFLPISKEELLSIHQMLEAKFNMPLDRLSGHIGRLLRNPLREKAKLLIKR